MRELVLGALWSKRPGASTLERQHLRHPDQAGRLLELVVLPPRADIRMLHGATE